MKTYLLLSILLLWLRMGLAAQQDDSTASPESEFVDAYIVLADTGTNYWKLRSTMLSIAQKLPATIDTMNRTYNSERRLIVLPDDDPDEMYAGEYYPRRSDGDTLSIEMWNYYAQSSRGDMMAVVYGIYSEQADAQKALAKLRKQAPRAFMRKTKIYMGCMH